jgi:nitroreductase
MNETLKVINHRRSIRKYKVDPIPDEDLQQIICAALYAPSARNRQEWHFTVIQNEGAVRRVKETMRYNMLQYGNEMQVERASAPDYVPFHDAPVIVILSANAQARFIQLDCGAAAQNLMLAADSLGISSCFMASSEILFKSKKATELKKELGIPVGYDHICAITLGYKDCEDPAPAPRKDGLVNYIK